MAHRPRRERQSRADSADERVRRLLADARHTGPMPADVVTRLDRVLADLAAHQQPDQQPDQPPSQLPGQPGAGGVVTDLSARRRRRATTLLVAAAAVVAVGVGIDRLASSSSSSGSASSSAGRSVDGLDGPAQDAAEPPDGADAGGAGSAEHSTSDRSPGGLTAGEGVDTLQPLVRVRPEHFSEDADRARRAARHSENSYNAHSSRSSGSTGSMKQHEDRASLAAPGSPGTACERADWGRGEIIGVRYDHAIAVLVLRPPHGDTQVADLFRCGSTDLLRSSTLPRHIADR